MARLPLQTRRSVLAATLGLLLLLVAAEIGLRLYGVADPVVRLRHPTIEYLPRPSSEYRQRFNRIAYNRWSQRGPDYPRAKAAAEFRVLIVGDSVADGGSHVDQAEHVSALLGRTLGATVATAAAASWGPPNQLAYLHEYGTFDADALVIIASSHDASDSPSALPGAAETGQPIERVPALALLAAVARFLPDGEPKPAVVPGSAMPAFREMIALCAEQAPTLVILHRERGESAERLDALETAAREGGAEVVRLELDDADYRDNIHLRPGAYLKLAGAIERWARTARGR